MHLWMFIIDLQWFNQSKKMLYLSASFYNKSRQSINETCKFVGTILNNAMIDFKNGIRWNPAYKKPEFHRFRYKFLFHVLSFPEKLIPYFHLLIIGYSGLQLPPIIQIQRSKLHYTNLSSDFFSIFFTFSLFTISYT